MDNTKKNGVRVFIAVVAFIAFYWACPLDLMPGNLIDDFAVTAVVAFFGYWKNKGNKQIALSYNNV